MAPPERHSGATNSERERGLVHAFQDVTENVVALARNHVELAKAEVRHDAKVYGEQSARVAVGASIVLLGFAILNAAFILVAWWLGGVLAAGILATVLALGYMGFGGLFAKKAMDRMKEIEGMRQTKTQMQRSQKWVKEIAEESSQKLPAPTSSSPKTETTKSPD